MILNICNSRPAASLSFTADGTEYKITEGTVKGVYTYVEDGDSWELALLCSGKLKVNATVTAFLVGGGAGGGKGVQRHAIGGGGGSITTGSVTLAGTYDIVTGKGGAGAKSNGSGSSGGDTTAFGLTAKGGICSTDTSKSNGGQTGGTTATSAARNGGDGTALANSLTFPEKKFGAGGGAGAYNYFDSSANTEKPGTGGTDGGGAGGNGTFTSVKAGGNASFYGAGGGGGSHAYYQPELSTSYGNGGSGYQGIVIIKKS